MAAQRALPVQIPKRSSGETVQPKTQLGTDNRDSESIFGKLGEKSGLDFLRLHTGPPARSLQPVRFGSMALPFTEIDGAPPPRVQRAFVLGCPPRTVASTQPFAFWQ